MKATQNIHVRAIVPLIPPRELKARLPMSPVANATVVEGREAVQRILSGHDPRMMVVVGPCSIHDEHAALEYAAKLREVAAEVQDQLFVLMRVYFEKPRTTVGWKGLINDPGLNDTFDMELGLTKAREILLKINEMGLPAATEVLDPITPQYIADLVTWASIGARTTESQTHRQLSSGLSMPIGYKNATDGNLQIAIDAMQSGRAAHSFLGIDGEGRTCIVHTSGNPFGHLILRGGRSGPNYDAPSLRLAEESLVSGGLPTGMIVDCSHANSNKDYRRQGRVWNDVLEQRRAGNRNLIGMMLESNINEGQQKLPSDFSELRYGVSITDGCIGWDETKELLLGAREALARGTELAAVPGRAV